jgi:cysteinyl-tRNA synthetase
MDLEEFTERYVGVFLEDIAKLNIKREKDYPRASENVDIMLDLAGKLVERGYAYEKLKSVYFDISKLDDYGRLSNIDLEKIRHGKTVDLDYYEKDSPMDFTLLKRSTLAELKKGIYFKTRWGNVRPSWHLECAAISLKYMAETFDIYASGSDIIFPHCENVMAIGKAATGKQLANYWLNTELVMMEGKKMSRSLDNFFTMEDLEKKGYKGGNIRYFLLSSHYRKPLNFSFGALDTARNTVNNLNGFIQRLLHFTPGGGFQDIDQFVYDVKHGFTEAMDDDFNISGALASIFEFAKKVNLPLDGAQLSKKERDKVLDVIRRIDSVLGIMNFEEEALSEEVRRLLKEREEFRRAGNWKESDRIRDKLEKRGIIVQDTTEGTKWMAK